MANEIQTGNEDELAAKADTSAFPELEQGSKEKDQAKDIEFIRDIPVQLSVEIGRAKISIKSLLQLSHGSVIELDAAAGDLMDVYVNGRILAKGEVVIINEKFGLRLTQIITPVERIRKLNK